MARDIAAAVIRHVESLELTEGPHRGKRFTLDAWQRKFVRGAFREGIQTGILSVARGGGKSTLSAGIATAAAEGGPLFEPRGLVVLAAAGQRQVEILFHHIQSFMASRFRADRKRWGIRNSTQRSEITDHETGWRLLGVPMEPGRVHGLAPSLTIMDEVAQWPKNEAEEMFTALKTAAGKQSDSRQLLISTYPAQLDNPMRALAEKPPAHCYVQIHRARDFKITERNVKLANPGWRRPELWAALKREMEEAKKQPYPAAFLTYRMNMGSLESLRSFLVPPSVWQGLTREAPRRGEVFWGIDLGGQKSHTAIAAYWPASGRLEAVSFVGGAVNIEERAAADSVPVDAYLRMRDRNELIEIDGYRMPPVSAVLSLAADRFGIPAGIASDRHRQPELLDALSAAGLYGQTGIDFRGMGMIDGAADVSELDRAIENRKVRPMPNYLLDFAMSVAVVRHTIQGRRIMVKAPSDDAAVASCLAVSLGERRLRAVESVMEWQPPLLLRA